MAWASTQPAAIDALVAALRNTTRLDPQIVLDGPTVSGASMSEAVTVGWTGDETDTTAVDGTLVQEGAAVEPSREQFTITCAASVVRGGGDITAARARAYELLSAVGAVLAADKTLGGVVMSARVGEVTLTQAQPTRGAVAVVVFGVVCDAYTRR